MKSNLAYPQLITDRIEGTVTQFTDPEQPGMTLLDYFAGQALAGMTAFFDYEFYDHDVAAKNAYDLAEAMLAEKARREFK